MSIADYVKNEKTVESINRMIEEAQKLAGCGITMTQIRGIFGHVRRLDAKGQNLEKKDEQMLNLQLLVPRIHYRIKRFLETLGRNQENEKNAVKQLSDELLEAIKVVKNDPNKFARFVEAFETIVAYMPRK